MRDVTALIKLLHRVEKAHTEKTTVLIIETPRGLWNLRAHHHVHMKWFSWGA